MMFPDDGRVVTIDKLTYHPPIVFNSLENVILVVNNSPFIHETIGLGIFKYAFMLGVYHKGPPQKHHDSICVLSSHE